MTNKKTLIMCFLMGILLVLTSGIATATDQFTGTFVTPLSNGEVSASYTFNVTFVNTSASRTIHNASMSYTPSGGSATVMEWNKTVTGGTAGNNTMTWTVETGTFLSDNTTYTMTVTAYNESNGVVETKTATGITVDNTVPAVTVTVPASDTEYKESIAFSGTATNASACYIAYNNKVKLATLKGTACTGTLYNYEVPSGIYDNFGIKAVDASAAPDSTFAYANSVMFTKEAGAVKGAVIDADMAGLDFENQNQKGIVILVLLGVGLLYYFNKKK